MLRNIEPFLFTNQEETDHEQIQSNKALAHERVSRRTRTITQSDVRYHDSTNDLRCRNEIT